MSQDFYLSLSKLSHTPTLLPVTWVRWPLSDGVRCYVDLKTSAPFPWCHPEHRQNHWTLSLLNLGIVVTASEVIRVKPTLSLAWPWVQRTLPTGTWTSSTLHQGLAFNQSGKQPLILCKWVVEDWSNLYFTALNSEVIFPPSFCLRATSIFWQVFTKYMWYIRMLHPAREKETRTASEIPKCPFPSCKQLLYTHFKYSACKNTIASQSSYRKAMEYHSRGSDD